MNWVGNKFLAIIVIKRLCYMLGLMCRSLGQDALFPSAYFNLYMGGCWCYVANEIIYYN